MRREDTDHGRWYYLDHEGRELKLSSVTSILNIVAKPYLVPWAAKMAAEGSIEYLRERIKVGETLTQEALDAMLDYSKDVGKKKHKRIVGVACEIGTITHELIEHRVLTDEMITDEMIEGATSAYLTELKEALEYIDVPDVAGIHTQIRACTDQFESWWRGMNLAAMQTEVTVYSAIHQYAGTLDCLATNGDGLVLCDWKTSNQYSTEYALQTVAYKMAYQEIHGGKIGDIYVVRIGKLDAELEVIHIPESDHDMLFEVFINAKKLHEWKAYYKHKKPSKRAAK